MIACLVDSSAFIALENANEIRHEEARAALAGLVDTKTELVTTNFVFDETYTLLLARLGRFHAARWGEGQLASRTIRMVRLTEEHESRAWGIIQEFADKDFSYTDATSFAVAEELGIEAAFSFDHHFEQYGRLQIVP